MYTQKQLSMMGRDQLEDALIRTQQQLAAIQKELKVSKTVQHTLYKWLEKGQAAGPRPRPRGM